MAKTKAKPVKSNDRMKTIGLFVIVGFYIVGLAFYVTSTASADEDADDGITTVETLTDEELDDE